MHVLVLTCHLARHDLCSTPPITDLFGRVVNVASITEASRVGGTVNRNTAVFASTVVTAHHVSCLWADKAQASYTPSLCQQGQYIHLTHLLCANRDSTFILHTFSVPTGTVHSSYTPSLCQHGRYIHLTHLLCANRDSTFISHTFYVPTWTVHSSYTPSMCQHGQYIHLTHLLCANMGSIFIVHTTSVPTGTVHSSDTPPLCQHR